MSEKKEGGCIGCLGSLTVLTFLGSLIFGGGVLYRIGTWQFALGGDVVDRQSIINTYLNNLEDDKKIADEFNQKFRTQMEQGQYQAVYDQASDSFKKSQTLSQWINLCETINRNLGSLKSTQIIDNWLQPTSKKSEAYVLLRYMTTFAKGQTQEDSIWLVKDNKPELIQYYADTRQSLETPKKTQVISLVK